MRRFLIACLVAAPVVAMAQAPSAPAPERPAAEPAAAQALPVRRVILYKTGVGYFEHLGNVRNRQNITIRFTSAQLNDVLNSLTVLDLGKGQITGISYNSVAPLHQRLGALRLPLDESTSQAQMLGSLRGARVEVSSGTGAVEGRMLSVEQRTRQKGDETTVIDMKALRGSAEEKQLLQRYTRQLDAQETRLDTLQTEIGRTTTDVEKARGELAALIGSVSFDVTAR